MSKNRDIERLYNFTDKELQKYIDDREYCNDVQKQAAVKEANRRKMNKIEKTSLLIKQVAAEEANRWKFDKTGKTSLLMWIALGFIVATFIISILTFLFK